MTDVVRVIRQSQGTEDSISPSSSGKTRALAENLDADLIDTVDLNNHSGFSLFRKDPGDERLDSHPEVQKMIEGLRAGQWDYLIAHDDTRIARDEFYSVIQYAAPKVTANSNSSLMSRMIDSRSEFRGS